MKDDQAPTRFDYETSFQAYVSRVEQVGGRVFNIEQDSQTGLYTWAAIVPRVDRGGMDRRLAECHADFQAVEASYAHWVLGVTPEV